MIITNIVTSSHGTQIFVKFPTLSMIAFQISLMTAYHSEFPVLESRSFFRNNRDQIAYPTSFSPYRDYLRAPTSVNREYHMMTRGYLTIVYVFRDP